MCIRDSHIGALPIIKKGGEETAIVSETVKDCIKLSLEDWNAYETSWDFKKHPLL